MDESNLTDDQNNQDKNTQFCQTCGVSSIEKRLVSKKKRENSNHNSDSEIFLCVNCHLEERVYELIAGVNSEIKSDDEYVTSLQENKRKEPMFKREVYQMLSESKDKKWELRDLNNAVSEMIRISPLTARRYLDKMCSSAGALAKKYDGKTIYVTFKMDGFL